jgi:hypothetical protein
MSEDVLQEIKELVSDMSHVSKNRNLNPLENRALKLLKESAKAQLENE